MDRYCSRIFFFFSESRDEQVLRKLGVIFLQTSMGFLKNCGTPCTRTQYAVEEDIVSRNSSRSRRKTGRKSACRVNLHARFLNNVLRTSILLDFRFTKNLIFRFSLPLSKGKKKYSFDVRARARERERTFYSFFSSQLEEEEKKKKNSRGRSDEIS